MLTDPLIWFCQSLNPPAHRCLMPHEGWEVWGLQMQTAFCGPCQLYHLKCWWHASLYIWSYVLICDASGSVWWWDQIRLDWRTDNIGRELFTSKWNSVGKILSRTSKKSLRSRASSSYQNMTNKNLNCYTSLSFSRKKDFLGWSDTARG